jgi:starvation-inducible DNA-binding protein
MENQALINYLNQLLSNQCILFIKLHRYHWYIKGNNFYMLHQYFEKLYNRIATEFDETAERILMIGGKPLATMSKLLKEGTLEEANADDTEQEIIAQLIHDFQQMVQEINETGLSLADEYRDEVTIDLLTGQLSNFEKEIWMLKSYQEESIS